MAIPDIVVNIAADTDSLASGLTAAKATLSNFTTSAVSTFQKVSEASSSASEKMAAVINPLKDALASGVFGEAGKQAAESMENLAAAGNIAKDAFNTIKTAMSGGILGVVNGLIEAGQWFIDLSEKAGGFGEAMTLLVNIGKELLERFKIGFEGLEQIYEATSLTIKKVFIEAFQYVQEQFFDMVNWVLVKSNEFMAKLNIRKEFELIGKASTEATNTIVENLGTRAVEAANKARIAIRNMSTPLGSWIALQETIKGKGDNEKGGDDGKGKDKSKGWEPTVEKGDELEEKYERLQKHLMSREELLKTQYEKDRALLNEYYGHETADKEKHNADMLALQTRYEKSMTSIRVKEMQAQSNALLGGAAELFGALGERNKKMLRVSKIIGAAQAMVSTMIGAAKALELAFPFNIGAAMSVIAKGISFVNAIKSTNEAGAVSTGGGGGGGGASFGAGAGMPSGGASARSTAAVINLSGGDMFSRKQIVDLINSINEAMEDGARIRIA